MASSAAERILRLAQPSACADPVQANEAAIMCEAAKEVMQREAAQLVQDAAGLPILSSKSCDGTPLVVVHRSLRFLPSGRAVRSQGKQGREFLVSNQFLRMFLPGQGTVTKAILGEAVPLTCGKKVPAILAASHRNWVSLRSMGHCGISLEHYVWDRLSIVALERLTRKWHLAQGVPALPNDIPEETARMSEIVCVTPCALHDAQNSFKWALFNECCNADLQRDVYIAVESLRNSADLISRYINEWIMKRLSLVPPQPSEWVDRRRELWYALGVDLEVAELLATDLQLAWSDGHLKVNQEADNGGDLVQTISSALMETWRFVKFTTSRWLTVGSSSRCIVAGMLTGLSDIVDYIARDRDSDLFYLKG